MTQPDPGGDVCGLPSLDDHTAMCETGPVVAVIAVYGYASALERGAVRWLAVLVCRRHAARFGLHDPPVAPATADQPSPLDDPLPRAEQWARAILDRPDQIHTVDHTHLRTLLDSARGYRAAVDGRT